MKYIKTKDKENNLAERRMGRRDAERDEKQKFLQERFLKLSGTMGTLLGTK